MEGELAASFETSFGLSSLWDNPSLITREKLPTEREKKRLAEVDDVEIVPPPTKKTRGRKKKEKEAKIEDKEDEEKNSRNWTDVEAEALIHLQGEMNIEFIRNAKKQGVDMWLKLHARLLCILPEFKKTPKACKNKYQNLFKDYTKAKHANNVFGESRHQCKYYEAFNTWWHQSGSVMKHVSASTNDTEESLGNEEAATTSDPLLEMISIPKQGTSSNKSKFHDQALTLFSKMVDNSAGMMQSFKNINVLLERVDVQMDRLIEKL